MIQSWGFIAAETVKNRSDLSHRGSEIRFRLIEIHALCADLGISLNPVTKACGQDHGMVEWVHVQPWSGGRQEGRRVRRCQYKYSSLQGDEGLKVNEETLIKWRASCSHPLPDCNRSWFIFRVHLGYIYTAWRRWANLTSLLSWKTTYFKVVFGKHSYMDIQFHSNFKWNLISASIHSSSPSDVIVQL